MEQRIRIIISDLEHDGIEDVDRKTARKHADQIADLLDGKVMANPQWLAINEPLRPFVIPLSIGNFKAQVSVSDADYSFDLNHRKGQGALLEDALFCVSFKTPDRIMFTRDRVAGASKALGVDVYRQGFVKDRTVAKYLLREPVRSNLARIDFKPLVRLFLSPIQLRASSKLKDPPACAAQVRVFMALMNALACARKPEKPKPAANRKRSVNRR